MEAMGVTAPPEVTVWRGVELGDTVAGAPDAWTREP